MKFCSGPGFRAGVVVAVTAAALLAGCATRPTGITTPGAATGAGARLDTARSAWQAGQAAAAWKAVKPLVITDLPPAQRLPAAELKAAIALAVHRPRIALRALAAAPAPVEADDQARFLGLKARALFADDRAAEGLERLVERGRLFTAAEDVNANNLLTWTLVSAASPLPSASGLSATAQGWIALAKIQRTAWEEPDKFARRIQDWSADWPEHPANGALLARIQAEEQARLQYPPKVALLLPLSGAYAEQARAVEAGLLAAYYRSAEPRPQIAIFDTAGTAMGARAALSSARAASADFIVGPLTPSGVNAIVPMRPFKPVLALNYLDKATPTPPRFFQFGLAPAQQAQAAAERAVSQGLARAVVLVPANDWGRRIVDAFTQRLTALGGQVLASAEFEPGAVKFAAPLTSLFGVDLSLMREQQLSDTLGRQLEFTPRRRQDIQFVFFAAPFTTARLLVPQIDYYHGIGLPVYSIANLYQVGMTPNDLNGVHFPIMPWFVAAGGPIEALRKELAGLYPQSWRSFAPLYALGYDAWRLIPLLGNAQPPLKQPVRGVTGMLSLGPDNVIVRRADWARYLGGKVQSAASPTHP